MSHTISLHPWDQAALLDHASAVRTDPDELARWWADPDSRLVVIDDQSGFSIDPFGQPTCGRYGSQTFLGFAEGRAWFADFGEVSQRVTIRCPDLSAVHYQIVSAALAALNWRRAARYCTRCAGRLNIIHGGFAAQCDGCGREEYPRTDPAVIVAVLDDDDRLFLAHQGSWGHGRVSILAGFVEAGESGENAVYREVEEESQLTIRSLRFLGTQPWPFPRSLMLGYVARAHDVRAVVDGEELEWGGWYTRDEVSQQVSHATLSLPQPGSIAHRIIQAWRDGILPRPEC